MQALSARRSAAACAGLASRTSLGARGGIVNHIAVGNRSSRWKQWKSYGARLRRP
jgi:hypothetical protein